MTRICRPDRIAAVGIAAFALMASQSVSAQAVNPADTVTPPGGQVDQSAGTTDRLPIDQLSRPRDRSAGAAQLAPRNAVSRVMQLDAKSRDVTPANQISTVRRDVRPAVQLATGRASADASQPLSRPADGRAQTVVRLGGRDRCDPQADTARKAACARVIETRSAEFVRPDPLILSPEQRLLIDQRLREGPAGPRNTVQKIGRNDIDADSMDAQGIASLALARPATPQDTEADAAATGDGDVAAAALIQAIIQGSQNGNVTSTPR